MKWYQIKEQAAGEKRLMLLWYIYKIFGKNIVRFITIFIAFFTFIFAKPIRKYSHKNLGIIYNFTQNQSAKPTIYNCFKLISRSVEALGLGVVFTGAFTNTSFPINHFQS